MKKSSKTISCVLCGGPLDEYDIEHEHAACDSCRSWKGKLLDLDIAIRASGDSSERITEWWPEIRHLLRKRFNTTRERELTPVELWERFTDWLRVERGLKPNDYLRLPLSQVVSLLIDAKRGRKSSAFVEKRRAIVKEMPNRDAKDIQDEIEKRLGERPTAGVVRADRSRLKKKRKS